IVALEGVDLAIDRPEIVGLVRPNGAGKTTLIRCLLGLTDPSEGTARVDGTDATDLRASDRRRLGYMPQREALYPALTVAENVDFFARLYGVPERAEAVDRALGFVDLQSRRDARIDELSGGMARRTSLACTLVADPEVLLLDEPTVGLDPTLRSTLWSHFRSLRAEGRIILVSTHYLGEAHRCDRVLFLRSGSIVAFDTPSALLAATDATDLEEAFRRLVGAR
ncbi:MAG: ABC transporter ATP-binding protein, partial [Halobacteriota archaeon]